MFFIHYSAMTKLRFTPRDAGNSNVPSISAATFLFARLLHVKGYCTAVHIPKVDCAAQQTPAVILSRNAYLWELAVLRFACDICILAGVSWMNYRCF